LRCFACYAVAAACLLAGDAFAATLQRDAIVSGGVERTYTIYLPDDFDQARRYPVLMVLHGGGGDAALVAEQTGFSAHVDGERFVLVFPEAGGRQWNDGRETTRSEYDDVAFLKAVVQSLVEKHSADPAHVFVAGVSNGGMMAQRLACEASETFAGFAIVNANMPADLAGNCRPSHARPFALFFGTEDPIMPPAGGEVRSARQARLGAGGEVVAAADTVKFWAQANGCGAGSERPVSDRAEDGTTVRQLTYQTCMHSTQVVEFEIVGGGHTWPGSAPAKRAFVRRVVGNTSHDIDATATIVAFFRAYGL
jgi:polyhydroxybutyrate depolymerase